MECIHKWKLPKVFKQIMTLYDIVYKLLKDHPTLRSDDKKLTWSVWAKEGLAWETMTKEAYLKATSAESITRARRKVQEEHPELCANEIVTNYRSELEHKAIQTKGSFIAEGIY